MIPDRAVANFLSFLCERNNVHLSVILLRPSMSQFLNI